MKLGPHDSHAHDEKPNEHELPYVPFSLQGDPTFHEVTSDHFKRRSFDQHLRSFRKAMISLMSLISHLVDLFFQRFKL